MSTGVTSKLEIHNDNQDNEETIDTTFDNSKVNKYS